MFTFRELTRADFPLSRSPDPRNARAVRRYEKVGFRAIRELTTPDGPSLWMVLRREEFTGDASTRPAQRRP
jgi:hypothetical protein